MHYLVYQTTNNINKKIYVGMHKTMNINDGYLGSGKLLRRAIKKYGAENFIREILFDCISGEEMVAKEIKIVDENFVAREDTYNLQVGGLGGSQKGRPNNWGDKVSKALKGRKQPPRSKSHRRALSISATGNTHGKGHLVTEEHKGKIRAVNSRAVIINGITYQSRLSAGKAYNVLPETILCWIKAGKAMDDC